MVSGPALVTDGVSEEALALYRESEVFDLHTESFSFARAFGYDLRIPHDYSLTGSFLVGQADFPRLAAGGVRGAIHSITANPLRPYEDRETSFAENLALFESLAADAAVPVVSSFGEYRAASKRGNHVAFLGIQGTSALPSEPAARRRFLPRLVKVCLVHLTDNWVGPTSTTFGFPRRGLTLREKGRDFLRELEEARVLVDLAHLHPDGIDDALRHTDPRLPLLVSHTAMSVKAGFRSLSDAHARAVAARGGVLGIIFHSLYLGDGLFRGKVRTLAKHIVHALDVAGEDHVALGSDWDGLICTPRDMKTCLELPRLVDALLAEKIEPRIIRKVLGENALRLLREVRP